MVGTYNQNEQRQQLKNGLYGRNQRDRGSGEHREKYDEVEMKE